MEAVEHQDLQHLYLLESITSQPVFILGLHRSGTSSFNPVTAYHLIKYHQLLHNHITKQEERAQQELTHFFKEQGQLDRGIDRLQLTADFAEEYGFLLGEQTATMSITRKNLPLFTEMAKKIQFIAENNKPILLKNPYDFSNFLYIKRVLPNAKFIFIHRHPYKSLSSLVKAGRFLLANKSLYTDLLTRNYNKIFENPLLLYPLRFLFSRYSPFGMILLTLHSSKAVKYYIKNIQNLSKKDYVSITYENLCENPQNTMEDIIEFLNIKHKKMDFTSFIKPRKTNLDPSVIKLNRFISKTMRHYFTCFGYNTEIDTL